MGLSLDFNQLAPFLNQNIKSQKPDGATEFFDDADMLSAAIQGQLPPAQTAVATPTQAVAAPAAAQPVQGQQPGGIQRFLETPGAIQLFGDLAQAFTATAPNSIQNQIGQLASSRAQSQIFKQLLEDLTNQAVGGGSPANPPSALGVL